MKRRSRILSIFLLFIMLVTMMPVTASAASKKPGKTKITGITVALNNVTVRCKKAKNAKSYRLYNVTYGYKWKYLKKIKSSQKKKYSDTAKYQLKKSGKKYKVYKKKAVAKYSQLATSKKTTITFTGNWNTTYTLAVRAYNGKKAGKYSSAKQVTTGKAPAPAPTPAPAPAPAPASDPYNCDTYVFFGSDSRATDESWKSPDGGRITTDATGTEGVPRSDVIMLLNVNKTKKTIDFISIYRDTALNKAADGFNFQKANKAYADYGPEEACRVLERNLDIKIKGYAASNFKGVADMIDSLGEDGVEVDGLTVKTTDVSSEAGKGDDVADVANNYIDEMNRVYGLKGTEAEAPHIVKGEDRQRLSGLQAVGYARVRYTDGSDRQRTMRQKAVLVQMIKKYRELSAAEKIAVIMDNEKAIDTNLGLKELAELIEAVSEYTIDENLTNSPGFPYFKNAVENYVTEEEKDGVAVLIVPCDLQTNVKEFHKRIYGENSYVPGSTVVSYSNKLKEILGSKKNKDWDFSY